MIFTKCPKKFHKRFKKASKSVYIKFKPLTPKTPNKHALRGSSKHQNAVFLHQNSVKCRQNAVFLHQNSVECHQNAVFLHQNAVFFNNTKFVLKIYIK